MPSHCNENNVEGKRLSAGLEFTVAQVQGNDLVDKLAKQIAERDKMPDAQLDMVKRRVQRLRDIGVRIGRCTA